MDARWAFAILLSVTNPGHTASAEKIPVEVYIQNNNWPQSLRAAERLASEIFERSKVHVTWHDGELPAIASAGRTRIGIRLVHAAPASISRKTLASARPYGSSGSLISIYQDRIEPLLKGGPDASTTFLASVFAHELAHVILGSDYHSESGILKAAWSNADLVAMRARRFDFSESDSERIRDALTVRLAAR